MVFIVVQRDLGLFEKLLMRSRLDAARDFLAPTAPGESQFLVCLGPEG